MGLSGLWLPESAREPAEKVLLCVPCGKTFPREQRSQFQRHVVACAEANPESIEQHIAAQEASPFTSIDDPEQFGWIRRRAAAGRKATKGGRAA